ncbi:small multidrug resistance family-3 protein [Pseudomonas duriflava]|uniref:Small multidrug resistance family-3 protein n=1 Tax=Pseudomonas duriflava TaxID=459528 RepID=A0A562QG00_9PSED|nr:YnfA family protein [Pseudomonas duriflava]TWI55675.1 small multidrug resistance family-3 protein [Pseudomonas duriflava]
MLNYLWFTLAAVFEIAGCYTFWLWLRLEKSPLWLLPGMISLACFALVLTRVEAAYAGRAYAAYGGIYIVASLFWLGLVEKTRPGWTDLAGAALCLLGVGLLVIGPRFSSQ